MNYFISLLLIAAFIQLPLNANPAPALDAVEFYDGISSALQITKAELRVMKLLELLKKYPSKTEELYPLLQKTLKQAKFTPAIRKYASEILNENPYDLLINHLLFQADSDFDSRIEKWKKLLLNCPAANLSPRQEQAVLLFSQILLQHFASRELCEKNSRFLTDLCDRFNNGKNSTRFHLLFLGTTMDIYRQLIWETDCTAYGCKRWDELPETDIKKRYIRAQKEISGFEKNAEYPMSLELLKIYNRNQHSRRSEYARTFVGTSAIEVIEIIFAIAQITKDSTLIDPYLDFEPLPGRPLRNSRHIAVIYAQNFKQFDLLKKLIPPAEFEIIQLAVQEKYSQAAAAAGKLLTDGKISVPATVRAIIEAIWHTKEIALLQKTITLLEKNPALLTAENANSAAYSAAVLNISLDKAEKFARAALKQLPDSSAVLDTMAYIMYRKKDFIQADRFITAALLQITPGDSCATIYLHAAEIELAHNKNMIRATKMLKRAKLAALDNDYEYDYKRADELQEILNK